MPSINGCFSGFFRRQFLLFFFLAFSAIWQVQAQSTALFNDSILATVKVWVSSDSLAWLYANPLNNNYLRADMVYEDGIWSDTVRSVGFRLRGNTSRFSRKKSFKISFNTFQSGRRYQGVKKFNLNGQHNDPTLVREKFFYHLWNKAGMPERRTVFVKLMVNDLYMGLYTGLEELDKDWLQRTMGENGGNLFKCTYPADMVYLGPDQQAYKQVPSSSSTGGRAYSLETNEAEDDYTGLVQLAAMLQSPVTASFPQNIQGILDVPMVLKALALDVSAGNWDNYSYNKNNYFLYQHQGSAQFRFISYDTDNTFGVDWVNRNWATRSISAWPNNGEPRPLVKKLLEYSPYRELFYSQLDSINRYLIHPDSCFPWLDHAKSHILQAVEADSFRTLDYGYSLSDFHLGFVGTVDGHTPYGIKPFLQLRRQSTDAQLAVLNAISLMVNSIRPYPNPFTDVLIVPDPGSKVEKIELQDILGHLFHPQIERTNSGGDFLIQAGDISPGFYLLKIHLKGGGFLTCPLIRKDGI